VEARVVLSVYQRLLAFLNPLKLCPASSARVSPPQTLPIEGSPYEADRYDTTATWKMSIILLLSVRINLEGIRDPDELIEHEN
jgi:hypothetical protein